MVTQATILCAARGVAAAEEMPKHATETRAVGEAAGVYIAAPLVGDAIGALAYQFIRADETRPAGVEAREGRRAA